MKVHLLLLSVLVLFAMSASAAPINLGTAANFGLLGGSGITNAVSGTLIQGDVGSSPTPAVTGFPPGVVVGTIYTTYPNAVTAQAQSDLTIAYNAAASAACNTDLTGQDLGGKTLFAGVYCFSSTAGLTGTLTLDAQGDPTAQWIFQIGSALTTGTSSSVVLKNGASPCNVFWQVGSSATIQTNNDFAGNILALTSITLNGGTLQGRALARNGAVTISGSEFVNSICVPSHPCVSIIKQPNRTAAAIGDTIIYTYTVCNCGPTTLTVDSVIDSPLGTLTGAFTTANGGSTTLPVGICAVFTANHTVTAGDPNPIVNTVTVNAHDSTGPTSDTATASVVKTPTPPGPCVSITKQPNRTSAAIGDTIIYTYTVCNCGPTTLTVDSVVDAPLGDLTTAFTTANGGSTLPVGMCAVFTANHTVTAGDPNPIVNTVTVNAHDSTGPTSDTATASVVKTPTPPGPCLSVAKVANRSTASVGDTVIYTFTICNCGTTTLTIDAVNGVSDSLLGDLTGAFVTANGGATLAAGACKSFTATRTVLGSDPNPLNNIVTVNAHDSAGTPATATDHWAIEIIPGPCLSVAKVPNRLTASVGDTIVYTFTVCNCGTPPVTVDGVVDTHFGDITADFVAANSGSNIIPTGTCVVFTKSRKVLLTDPSPLTNTVSVTAHAGTEILTPTGEATVTIVAPELRQAFCGLSCDPLNGINNGYGGITGDVISSVPGIFSFDPGGPDWPNFVPASGVVAYSITNVSLRKTVPPYVCTADIGGQSVLQQGTANITKWWPLMYELPGTTFTLTINYTTVAPFDDDGAGPHGATLTHVQVWTWTVGATLQGMKDLLEMFRELPLGTHQVPLVSDEALYKALQAKLDLIKALVLAGKNDEAGAALIEFILDVEDACIPTFTPTKPIAGGPGTGIANTCENPACCKILADADWVGIQLGLWSQ